MKAYEYGADGMKALKTHEGIGTWLGLLSFTRGPRANSPLLLASPLVSYADAPQDHFVIKAVLFTHSTVVGAMW